MLGQHERRGQAARGQLLHDGAHFEVAKAETTLRNRGEHPVHPGRGESVQVLGGNGVRGIDSLRTSEQQRRQGRQTLCQVVPGHRRRRVHGRLGHEEVGTVSGGTVVGGTVTS